jgi:hypothetical protein
LAQNARSDATEAKLNMMDSMKAVKNTAKNMNILKTAIQKLPEVKAAVVKAVENVKLLVTNLPDIIRSADEFSLKAV